MNSGDVVRFWLSDAKSTPGHREIVVEGEVDGQTPKEHGVGLPDEYLVVEMTTTNAQHIPSLDSQPDDVSRIDIRLAEGEIKYQTEYACVHPDDVLGVIA